MKARRRAALAAVGLVLVSVAPAATAWAAPSGTGTIAVTIKTPEGVPASVGLTGQTAHLASKQPEGSVKTVTVVAPADPVNPYKVDLPTVTFDGIRYSATSSMPAVVVREDRTTPVSVTYVPEPGARKLHVRKITQTSLDLAWTAPPGAHVALRRTLGNEPASRPTDGVAVPVSGATGLDQGLSPGTDYSYALFTQINSRWHGPLTVSVGTATASGSSRAAFVAPPTTMLATPADIRFAHGTGSGGRVGLQPGVVAPLVGAGVVLPISEGLPTGYLGVVTSVSTDGRTIELRPGALTDAFDYYEVSIADLSGGTVSSVPAASAEEVNSAAITPECNKARATGTFVDFAPSFDFGGHYHTKVEKYGPAPYAVTADMAVTATMTGAAEIDVTGDVRCNIKLGKLFMTWPTYPLPLALSLRPTVEVNAGGTLHMENVGFTATAGFQAKATIGLSGRSFSSSPIFDAAPLTPKVTTANAGVNLRVGGELIVGTGAGNADWGVIAGVGGELYLLDAGIRPHFPFPDPRFDECTVINAGMSGVIKLSAKAFVTKYFSAEAEYPLLEGNALTYGGSPWNLPNGCQNLAPPSDSAPNQPGDGDGDGDGSPDDDGTIGEDPGPFLPPPPPTPWATVAEGAFHTCGIKITGTASCWGNNYSGQLGDGTTEDRSDPVQVGADWATITAAGSRTCGVKTDGTAWCWGYIPSAGQLPATTPTRVDNSTNWTSLTVGSTFTCGLKTDRTVWCWGGNHRGQLGDGTLDTRWTPARAGVGTDWVAVTGGSAHMCGLKSNGTTWCWGANDRGQLGDGTRQDRTSPVQVGTGTNWKTLTAKESHTCGVQTNGSAWCWGANNLGQLGDGDRLVDWSNTTQDRLSPVRVGTDLNWASLAAGGTHTCGLKTDGTAWCWGYNYMGQLGDGTTQARSVPMPVGVSSDWASLSAGGGFGTGGHTCAVKTDGFLWCWGTNVSGQLGDGNSNTWSTTPVQVRG